MILRIGTKSHTIIKEGDTDDGYNRNKQQK